ncbi:MAG: DeoR/GlpR family DNA-binding transcription regulator [Xylanivirga thermophila]|jgi:DeoR/GlpR family transcriptional regulator of sugar metabolism|uniref:DeoR/GlpR family DNA-binding transcription regulator n=1 Tax=Xylanivirga thermophila TaxID=2496273 RepID=UPI0039F50B63
MLAIERRREIMTILQDEKSVLVSDLSKKFDVTEETIRRDLEKLEREGLVKRSYGGAVLNENTSMDLPFDVREITNIEAKQKIAQKVSSFIEDGDTLMIDSSSTALQLAKYIKEKKNITVITNSLSMLLELNNAENIRTISTGGDLRSSSLSFVGYLSEKAIKSYYVDKAILSCKAINMNKGILESSEMEAYIKKAMVERAQKTFLLLDSTKFDIVSFVNITEFDNIHSIFTDKKLSPEWEQFCQDRNVNIIYS